MSLCPQALAEKVGAFIFCQKGYKAMKKSTKIISLLLTLIMALSTSVCAYTADEMAQSVTQWLEKNISVEEAAAENKIDSYLDWTVFATARNGNAGYAEAYRSYIGSAVSANCDSFYLSDYARVALAVMSVGLNPKDIGRVNLLEKITATDFKAEVYTGGLFYALIALDAADYSPEAQQEILGVILEAQRDDGGFNSYVAVDPEAYWTVSGDPDSTGMALQALGAFKDSPEVAAAITKAVDFAKANQLDDGGYGSYGVSAESTAQLLMGLCVVGVDPLGTDFTKGENNMLTSLSAFINEDGGARCWDGSSNIMTSYQLLMAVEACERFVGNEEGLYELSVLDGIRHDISSSWIGTAVPAIADFIITIVEFFFNLLGLELYAQP